jgi:hypothetical protein
MTTWQDLIDAGQYAYEGIAGGAQNIGSVINEGDIRSRDLFDYNISDSSLGQSQYDFRYRVFPADLANDYVGHYMIININVPVFASDGTARTAYGGAAFGQNLFPGGARSGEFSKVDTLRFGNAENVGGTSPVTNRNALKAEPLAVPRYTRRIKESIAMFMPTPVTFNTINEFQEISLTGMVGGLATGAAALVAGTVFGETGASLATGAGDLLGKASRLSGYPINPRVEVMFSKTNLRQFVFEFLMAPRNEQESENMKAIVRTLRFHSAPELDSTTAGFTWIPPAEFDFTFYNKGVENTNIPRVNTCVLDRIEVDYAPQGVYSTFSNGHPVAARLSLGVREIEVVHKRRVLQGF